MSVVLLVWTDGHVRIPLAFRVWQKGGASKDDLALELLSYARNRLKGKPHFVLFDSWYPSKKLLKRLRDYGWYFVCSSRSIGVLRDALWCAISSNPPGRRQALCREASKYLS